MMPFFAPHPTPDTMGYEGSIHNGIAGIAGIIGDVQARMARADPDR